MNELKSCPFCEEPPIIQENEGYDKGFVRCVSHTGWMPVKAWNTRTPDISHEEFIEAFEEKISARKKEYLNNKIYNVSDEYFDGFKDGMNTISNDYIRLSYENLPRLKPAAGVENSKMLLDSASRALQSYQYGNSSPDLAKEISGIIDKALSQLPKGETQKK